MMHLADASKEPLTAPVPWSWKRWLTHGGRDHAPWIPTATPESTGLNETELDAVRALIDKYYALTDADFRTRLLTHPSHIDKPGRDALQGWFSGEWKVWGIWATLDEALEAHGKDIYSVAAEDSVSSFLAFLSL